jgi:dTDP-glucose 4,6-dehydratase
MKLLVTGALGFIARNFVDLSAQHPDWQLVLTDRRLPVDASARFDYQLDVTDEAAVEAAVASVDAVMHLAAETNNDISLRDPERFLRSNVIGTYNVLQACVQHDKRLHHVSTDEVFGDLDFDGDDRFTLDSPYRPSSPYSATKAASDHLVRAWVRSFGLRATISNCSNNFGPYQDAGKLIPRTIQAILAGERPQVYGSGRNVRDWIHARDHANGLWAALEQGEAGQTYLFSTDTPRSSLQVVQSILGLMGRPTDEFDFVSDRPGHDRRYAMDASQTALKLDWQPSGEGFEQQLGETVTWYRANPWAFAAS